MIENVASLLERVADAIPQEVAVIHGDREVTWEQIDARADRLAGHLAGVGIERESRVALSLYNSIEYIEALLAVLKLRAVPVNVNYRYRVDELAHVLADSGAEAIVFDASLADQVRQTPQAGGALRSLIQVGGEGQELPRWVSYERAIADATAAPRIERGNDTWLLYTGGTTGQPKAVVATHEWLATVCLTAGFTVIGQDVPATAEDFAHRVAEQAQRHRQVCLPAPPLMHGAGVYNTLATLLIGGVVVFTSSRSFDGSEVVALTEQHGIHQLSIVGDAFALPLVEALESDRREGRPRDMSSLRLVSSAGAAWSNALKVRLMDACGGEVVCQEIVSATEGGPFAISRARTPDEARRAGFVLAPGARLLGAGDRDIPPGSDEAGVLAAPTGESVRYENDPDRTREVFRTIGSQRYCVLGDLAVHRADGILELKGRGSDVINTGGEKVSTFEVEQVMRSLPGIRDVIVFGEPDPRWGQRVVAVVVAQGAEVPSQQSIQAAVGSRLAAYKRPRRIHFVNELRRSPAGKIDRAWARDVASASSPTSTTAASVELRPTERTTS